MKYVYLLSMLFLLLSCKKEKNEPRLVGNWTLIERHVGVGNGTFATSNHNPFSEVSLQFMADGNLAITHHNPLIANGYLEGLDRYQILTDNQIKFYGSASGREVIISYELSYQLKLDYPAICGFREVMIPVSK